MSEGFTPTQQTIRTWLGRTAANAAASPANDAVVNYIEAMGGDVKNLSGAALEYAIETDCQAVFDGVWNQVEVRGEFKCRRTEVPPEVA
ncbi:MAG: hypothetical protein V4532_00605, partial [Pseudomonadota bacterium]